MTILLTALALLHASTRPSPFEAEIYVKTDSATCLSRMASAVSPFGKVLSRLDGTQTYVIAIREESAVETVRKRLEGISGLHPVEPDDDPVDMLSVQSVGRKIADLTREERLERQSGHLPKAEQEKKKADYLQAYLHFVGPRSFPKDKVDWSVYHNARAHIASMKPTALFGKSKPMISGQSWNYVGPTNLDVPYTRYYGVRPVSGRFNAVAFDPNSPSVMYGGAAQGGLYKSTDGGVTWNWLSANWSHLGVNCIAIDPTNPNTIYVGLGDYHGYIGESVGVMKSTDGGSTWSEIGTGSMGQIGVAKIVIDPTASQNLIAGTGDVNSYGRLYRSTNGGQTWTPVSNLANAYWPAIAASAPVGNTVRFYAVAAGIAPSNGTPSSLVYVSDDHGATWQLQPSPVVPNSKVHWAYAVATSPTNPNNVYVLDSESEKLYASTNQGGNWTDISANFPHGNEITTDYNFSQSFYDYHLECGSRMTNSVTSDVLYVGEIDIVESADNGATWTSIGGPTYTTNAKSHNDQHALAVCPTNPNLALFSNDGGLYTVTYDPTSGTNSVVSLNQNLGATMFYTISMHPINANVMLGGTQDNATPVSSGDLANWSNVGGGDGGGTAINQTDPSIQYCTSEYLGIYRTNSSWTFLDSYITPSTSSDPLPFVTVLTLDPNNQYHLFTGTNYLYMWNDVTQTWKTHIGGTRLAGPVTANSKPTIQAIAIAPSDSNRIYTGSSDGQLWMTVDNGNTWKHINLNSATLPLRAITSISVSPSNSSDILVGLSGTGTAHLYRCSNTEAATPVYAVASGVGNNSLPDLPLNVVIRDLDNPATTWWVGTDNGVYQTIDSGTNWTNAGSPYGLPNVIVDDLVAVPGTHYLNAGTYGRGIWRILLPTPSPSLSDLTLNPTSVRRGGVVTGQVNLTYPAQSGGFTVNLTSSDAIGAPVPATVTIPAGSMSATFTIQTLGTLSSPESVTVTATAGAVTVNQNLSITVPTISGKVTFSDFLGPKPATVTLYFRNSGASTPFGSMTVAVDSSGNYLAQNVPTSAYTVYVQTGTWLRKANVVDLTTNDALTTNFVLINGDIDGNNRVDTSDLRLLSKANGSTSSSKNWNPKADLNGDGKVDSKDYAILYKNMRRIGDP